LPLAVGFGVSTIEQVAAVAAHADGVIVGSALVDMVAKSPDIDAAVVEVTSYLAAARAAVEASSKGREARHGKAGREANDRLPTG
jgi:tryptophan synthase alpha subunit